MNHRAIDPLQHRSAQGSGRRERFRWLVGATILFVLSSVGILHGGMKILWGAVPNRSDAISTTDQAFAARFRQRLEDETKVRLSGLTDFAWDTVCLIEPFDLDEASLREALHAGGLPDRSVRLPNGPKPIPQPNWLFAFLERGTVVHTVEFHHRELEPRHGAYWTV
ncbi:MAG TPA: hypothetical protein VHL31_01015 [Geminicoccus sp.]|uniref:hypothetical protein n=1 Tax=Geminicoccus sp. TaxID=2024832 RepID=UPI002E30FE0D|nr:hypothetical protein [Geminicoccus sp.]HEX2524869.1 hypothetical protein [Geminicoccus sp.]